MNGFQESLMFDVAPVVSPITLTAPEKPENKRKKATMLTVERLREMLDYDPESGVFVWKVSTSNRAPVGSSAGTDHGNGYRVIAIDHCTHYAHHLAWLFIYGEYPNQEMDHIDGNRSNNKISNLRHGTHAQNMQNLSLRATNKSGMTGVSWLKNYGKWEAYITVNYKKINLGYYDDLQEAGAAYLNAKQDLHRFQPVPRESAQCL